LSKSKELRIIKPPRSGLVQLYVIHLNNAILTYAGNNSVEYYAL
jgi:hypothetical protein